MNVLSLFDGMSCGQLALSKAGIKYENYFASEIKKHAIAVTNHNFPKTIQIGDVRKVHTTKLPKIDLLIGGSPCQDFSIMKANRENLRGEKSKLFYEYLRILKEVKPTWFLLENVVMGEVSKNELDKFLGVEGKKINSSLVSYQNRPRIYWTNIPFEIPKDRQINFQNFKEKNKKICDIYEVKKTPSRVKMWNDGFGRSQKLGGCANITNEKKIYCVTRKQDRAPNSGLIKHNDFCRYLTREELEQAQTVPVGYTSCVSYRQAQDLLGDGWTIDIVTEIFKGLTMKSKIKTEEKAHATFSASSSKRWLECPGSIKLSDGMPTYESDYAKEGTEAHKCFEMILKKQTQHCCSYKRFKSKIPFGMLKSVLEKDSK